MTDPKKKMKPGEERTISVKPRTLKYKRIEKTERKKEIKAHTMYTMRVTCTECKDFELNGPVSQKKEMTNKGAAVSSS